MPVAIVVGAESKASNLLICIMIFRIAPYDPFLVQDTWYIRQQRQKSFAFDRVAGPFATELGFK